MKRKLIALLLTMVFSLTFVCPAWGFSFGGNSSPSLPSIPRGNGGLGGLIPSIPTKPTLPTIPTIPTTPTLPTIPTIPTIPVVTPQLPTLPELPTVTPNLPLDLDTLKQLLQSEQFKNGLMQYLLQNIGKLKPAELKALEAYISPALIQQLINSMIQNKPANIKTALNQIVTQLKAKSPVIMAKFAPIIADYAANYLADQIIIAGYPGSKAEIKAILVPIITNVLTGKTKINADALSQQLIAKGVPAEFAPYLAYGIALIGADQINNFAPIIASLIVDMIAMKVGIILMPELKAKLVALLTPVIIKILQGIAQLADYQYLGAQGKVLLVKK